MKLNRPVSSWSWLLDLVAAAACCYLLISMPFPYVIVDADDVQLRDMQIARLNAELAQRDRMIADLQNRLLATEPCTYRPGSKYMHCYLGTNDPALTWGDSVTCAAGATCFDGNQKPRASDNVQIWGDSCDAQGRPDSCRPAPEGEKAQ